MTTAYPAPTRGTCGRCGGRYERGDQISTTLDGAIATTGHAQTPCPGASVEAGRGSQPAPRRAERDAEPADLLATLHASLRAAKTAVS